MRIHRTFLTALFLSVIAAGLSAQDALLRQLGDPGVPTDVRIEAAERLAEQMTLKRLPAVAKITGEVLVRRAAMQREYDRLVVIAPKAVKDGGPSTPAASDARGRVESMGRRLQGERRLAELLSGIVTKTVKDASAEELEAITKPLAGQLSSRRGEARVGAATTLGFLPTARSAKALLDLLGKPPASASTAAAEALLRHLELRAAVATELGVTGYRAVEKAHGKTLKAMLKVHKQYRTLAKKHAKLVGKAVDYVSRQLLRAFSGKNVKKRGKPKFAQIEKAEIARDEAAADLDAHGQAVAAMGNLLAGLYQTLPAADRDPVKAKLLKTLGSSRTEEAVAALEIAAATKDASVTEAVVAVLERAKDERVRVVACETLGRLATVGAIPALAKWMVVANWSVQISAMRALETIGGKDGVTALVDGIGELDGRARYEANEALRRLTGQNFHENPVLWTKWWKGAIKNYKGPPRRTRGGMGKRRAKREPEKRADTTFFGIVTRSKRIVFIVDNSGSMDAPLAGGLLGLLRARSDNPSKKKIDAAHEELKRAITSLPKDARFNIILYGTNVESWKPELIDATPDNKAAALEWVTDQPLAGETNIFDALTRALGKRAKKLDVPDRKGPDTIFLLTDGHANRGEILGSNEIADEFKRLNRYRKLIVHTIALGNGADVGFAKKLADENGGRFKHVTDTAGFGQ